jgi:predicted phosphodiesterase
MSAQIQVPERLLATAKSTRSRIRDQHGQPRRSADLQPTACRPLDRQTLPGIALPHVQMRAHRQSRARRRLRIGGHEGSQDVVGVSVEVHTGTVVTHGGAWARTQRHVTPARADRELPSNSLLLRAAAAMVCPMPIIAHISDPHFDGSERALARSRRTMAYLRGCDVDVILVTGDLTDHGDVKEYEQVKTELVADVPVLLLPGNHDDRAAYRKVLLGGDGTAPINQLHRAGGVLFALCDSTIPGKHRRTRAERGGGQMRCDRPIGPTWTDRAITASSTSPWCATPLPPRGRT